jgi:hypothetical protein
MLCDVNTQGDGGHQKSFTSDASDGPWVDGEISKSSACVCLGMRRPVRVMLFPKNKIKKYMVFYVTQSDGAKATDGPSPVPTGMAAY